MKKTTIRQDIVANVKSYNNTLKDDWIVKQTTRFLLGWTHPSDREDFRFQLSK